MKPQLSSLARQARIILGHVRLLALAPACAWTAPAGSATSAIARDNQSERVEWHQDIAISMHPYWTVGAQLGMVNTHSIIGVSPDWNSSPA